MSSDKVQAYCEYSMFVVNEFMKEVVVTYHFHTSCYGFCNTLETKIELLII